MNKKDISLTNVFEELAKLDPMIESYQGNISCYFCGAQGEVSGEVDHNQACLWFEAKQHVKREQELQDEHIHRFHTEDQESALH